LVELEQAAKNINWTSGKGGKRGRNVLVFDPNKASVFVPTRSASFSLGCMNTQVSVYYYNSK
jgi:hypothetical protein